MDSIASGMSQRPNGERALATPSWHKRRCQEHRPKDLVGSSVILGGGESLGSCACCLNVAQTQMPWSRMDGLRYQIMQMLTEHGVHVDREP